MEIGQIIQNIYAMPESSEALLIQHAEEVMYPKGHVLLRAGIIEKNIYLIKEGIVRAYSENDGGQITFWFGKEGDTAISMKSYVADEPGYEDIDLLEDCVLYKLDSDILQGLFTTDIHIANWGRKFAEHELIKAEERLISAQSKTAAQRYKDLIENHPDILRRVQLGYIASYLGITQASLSRIRAEIK